MTTTVGNALIVAKHHKQINEIKICFGTLKQYTISLCLKNNRIGIGYRGKMKTIMHGPTPKFNIVISLIKKF